MDRHSSLASFNVACGGLARSSCQNETTEPRLYYQGLSVQTLESPCSAYFGQSNADQNNAHPVNPLNKIRVAPLTQGVPDDFDKSDLAVIPQSFLDEYVPWNSGNESVDHALLTSSSSYLCNQSCFSGNELDIREPTPAYRLNPEHHLTNLPTGLASPQDSGSVAVINPLNLQQATSDNPANSAEIVDDKSSQVEQKKERRRERRRNPALLARERERQREYRKDPAFLARQRERQREYRKNPAFAERESKRHKDYRKNPVFLARERERKREYRKDPAFLARQRERRMERSNDPAFLARKRKRLNDPVYRELRRERQREHYRNDPVYAEGRRVYSRIYYRMRKKFGKEKGAKLASAARKRYLQSVNSPEDSGDLPQNSNKNLDSLPSQTD